MKGLVGIGGVCLRSLEVDGDAGVAGVERVVVGGGGGKMGKAQQRRAGESFLRTLFQPPSSSSLSIFIAKTGLRLGEQL